MDKKIDTNRTWPKGYEPSEKQTEELTTRLDLLSSILKQKPKKKLLRKKINNLIHVESSNIYTIS